MHICTLSILHINITAAAHGKRANEFQAAKQPECYSPLAQACATKASRIPSHIKTEAHDR